jgi:uncharacterized protein YjbJ (UPF0337 family)
LTGPSVGYLLGHQGEEDTTVSDTTDERLQFEGKWDQMRGRVKEAWGALSDDDLDRTEGKWDQVVGTIKEKTGESMDVIERKLRDISSK